MELVEEFTVLRHVIYCQAHNCSLGFCIDNAVTKTQHTCYHSGIPYIILHLVTKQQGGSCSVGMCLLRTTELTN